MWHDPSWGLAFTTVPLATESARYYREQALASGWQPTPDDVLYRIQQEVGAGIVDLSFQSDAMPFGPALRSLELFGKEVLPCLHEI